jgi:hypothetical protein
LKRISPPGCKLGLNRSQPALRLNQPECKLYPCQVFGKMY